jgi:hypothetical protein
MEDERGLYYYPYPQNKRVRMYVRRQGTDVCFRLWNTDDPDLWVQHGWIPYDAIRKAATMYDKKGAFDPDHTYNLDIAEALLKEKGPS